MNAPFQVPALLWRLRPQLRLNLRDDGSATLSGPGGEEPRPLTDTALVSLLGNLAEGRGEAELLANADTTGAAETLFRLRRLIDQRLVEAVIASAEGVAAVIEPCRAGFDLPATVDLPASLQLDRFAYLRAGSRGLTLEHPEAACRIVLTRPALGEFVARLAAEAISTNSIADPTERRLAEILSAFGFAAGASTAETPARQMWEFHDLLFHRASRAYGDWRFRGGSYRFKGALPAPPALRPAYTGRTVMLPAPDPTAVKPSEPCAAVMERRRSVRAFAPEPVALADISAILHRVARATSAIQTRDGQECYLRPVASGGGIQAVEVYLAVHTGQALEPGFYHYRGTDHALTQIAGAEAAARDMLSHSAGATRQTKAPPLVAVLAARVPRLAWKYEGIAYHLALLDAGIMLQSLYLAAVDLGLGGCAIGLGNSAAFQAATGNDAFEEVNVAEFAFGYPAGKSC